MQKETTVYRVRGINSTCIIYSNNYFKFKSWSFISENPCDPETLPFAFLLLVCFSVSVFCSGKRILGAGKSIKAFRFSLACLLALVLSSVFTNPF